MAYLDSVVSTDWLAARLHDPAIRVVDVSTYVHQLGAMGGLFEALPIGELSTVEGGTIDVPAFTLNGTSTRVTIYPGRPGGGQYRIWTGREVYEESHVPGAVFADIDEFCDQDSKLRYTALPHDAFAARAGALGLGDVGTTIVLYDQGIGISFWASRLWWQFRLEGFDDVVVLEGGFRKWAAEGRAVEGGNVLLPPVVFDGQRRDELLASIDEVEVAIDDPSRLIVDSLSPADYRGDHASYGGRGHIPSSINVFCASHTDSATNTLLPDDVLTARLGASGVLDEDKRVITYCGGGIGATWNALVLHHLGKTDVAVYDGSMFEWSSDPSRPLETA